MENIIRSASLHFEDTSIAFAKKSDKDLLNSYRLFQLLNHHLITKAGIFFTPLALKFHLPISPIIKATVFRQFCGGESLKECENKIAEMALQKVFSILDYGIEAQSGEANFDAALQHKLDTINYASKQNAVKVLSGKVSSLGAFALFEKYSSGKTLNSAEEAAWQRIVERMNKIGAACMQADIQLYWDAEETWIQPALDQLIYEQMLHFNVRKPIIFNTYQLYCKNRLATLMQHHEQAMKQGFVLGAKLVRGAYMEKERARAEKMNYPSPIHENKEAVNRDFNAALVYCTRHIATMAFCCASHNEESNALTADLLCKIPEKFNPSYAAFAQLLGMGDHITFNLANHGFFTLKLIPYGPIKQVIPYLLRRAEENSSLSGQMSRELILMQKEIQRRKL